MFILFWYVAVVTIVNTCADVYILSKRSSLMQKGGVIGAIIGLVIRQGAIGAFLLLSYPALKAYFG